MLDYRQMKRHSPAIDNWKPDGKAIREAYNYQGFPPFYVLVCIFEKNPRAKTVNKHRMEHVAQQTC